MQEEIGRQVAAKSDDGVLKILQMLSLLPLSLDDIREYQLGKTIKSLNRDSGSEGTALRISDSRAHALFQQLFH